jgi:hypothetical protein
MRNTPEEIANQMDEMGRKHQQDLYDEEMAGYTKDEAEKMLEYHLEKDKVSKVNIIEIWLRELLKDIPEVKIEVDDDDESDAVVMVKTGRKYPVMIFADGDSTKLSIPGMSAISFEMGDPNLKHIEELIINEVNKYVARL